MTRNFINTLRRHMMSSTLNIISLSVSFTAFLIIMMQVTYELGFDKFHSKTDQIHRVHIALENGTLISTIPTETITTLGESSSAIENYSLIEYSWKKTPCFFYKNGDRVNFEANVIRVNPSITDIFDFEMVQGTVKSLENPSHIIIPESLANKHFGKNNIIGRTIHLLSGESCEIGGVYKDFPSNSQLTNSIYRTISRVEPLIATKSHTDTIDSSPQIMKNNSSAYFIYVALKKNANINTVEQDMSSALKNMFGRGSTIRLTPMSELYFDKTPALLKHLSRHGNRSHTNMAIGLALCILIISILNFINCSTSLVLERLKMIGISKTLGASNLRLQIRLISESIGVFMISLGLSLFIVFIMSQSSFSDLIPGGISIGVHWKLTLYSSLGFIILGAAAGILPAIRTTQPTATTALKKHTPRLPGGRIVRMVAIGLQFVITIGLLTIAIFMNTQYHHLKNHETGIRNHDIVMVKLTDKLLLDNALEKQLLRNSSIKEIAYSQLPIGTSNIALPWHGELNDREIALDIHRVSWNFPDFMGIHTVSGKTFTENDLNSAQPIFLLNETTENNYYVKTGDKLNAISDSSDVRGIVKDFNYKSLHHHIAPMALVLDPEAVLPVGYIKTTGDPTLVINYIHNVAISIDPLHPIEINHYGKAIKNLYNQEKRTADTTTLLAILAFVISLVGLIGFITFETKLDQKEIRLRRIHGATPASILTRYSYKFVTFVTICFFFATPLAWYIATRWLQNFAYHAKPHWWIFLSSITIMILLTVITSTVQLWKTAKEEPMSSSKSE